LQLALLIAVVCALAQPEGDAVAPVGGVLWRVLLTLAGILVTPLAAALGSLPIVRTLAEPSADTSASKSAKCERIWSRVESAVLALWLAIVAATMYVLEWPAVVRSDWNLGRWPLVDEVVILAPVIVPLVLLWGVMFRLQQRAAATLATGSVSNQRSLSLPAFLWQNIRQNLALIVLSPLVFIGVHETAALLWPAAAASGRLAWLNVPLLGAMLVLLPLALARIWRTSPLPAGELRNRLVGMCRGQRLGVRDILVWHTYGMAANAAVAGVVRGLRYVFLTDRLLARLSADEVAAVVRHELGHVAGRHMLWRMLLMALPLAVWLALQAALPETTAAVSRLIDSESTIAAILLTAAWLAYALLVVARYSRWLEHEADLATCVARDGSVDRAAAECFARALVKIIGRGQANRWAQWLHPPLEERLAVLAVAIADPQTAVRFRRRLWWMAATIVAAYAIVAAVLLAA
jgi:STE24 endopeptidase